MGVQTVEQPINLFNQTSHTIVTVFVEEKLQHFVNGPQVNPMKVLPSVQTLPGTASVLVRLSTICA